MKRPKWSVQVKRLVDGGYHTVFNVGVQFFELARIEKDDTDYYLEAKQHCEFIKKMFEKALANLGVKKSSRKNTRRKISAR